MGSSSSTRRRQNLKPETDVGCNSYNYNPRPSITSRTLPAQPSEEYQQQRYQRQQQQQEQGTSRLNLSDPGYSSASAPIVSNRRASTEQKSAASVLRDEARARRLQKEEAAAAEERSRREAIRVAIPEQQQHILVVSARSASLPAIPTVARSSDNIQITNRSRPISSSARSMPTRTHPSSTSTSTYSSSSSSSSSSARQSALRQQLQAMQTMGVPRSLQLSFLNSEGDLDESTFQRLVTLIEAQAPAVVRGASKEIVNSLPTTNFSSERSESIGTSCLICLEDFEEGMQLARLPVCLHSFHLQCIRCWLVEKANCPVCRTEVK